MSQYVGPKSNPANLATQGDLGGGAGMPRCRVYRSTTQSLANNAEGTILFNAEDYDTDAMHSTATNTDRLVVPADGIYELKCGLVFPGNATGFRRLRVFTSVDPSSPVAGNSAAPGGASAHYQQVSWEGQCAAGDYFWVGATQTSGGAQTIGGASGPCWATLRRVA